MRLSIIRCPRCGFINSGFASRCDRPGCDETLSRPSAYEFDPEAEKADHDIKLARETA